MFQSLFYLERSTSASKLTGLKIVVLDVTTKANGISMNFSVPQWVIDNLKKDFPEQNFVHLKNWDEGPEHLVDMDILFGADLPSDCLAHVTRLKYIHSVSSGVDFLLYPEMKATDIQIIKGPGIQSIAVAEHAMMMMLTLAKRTRLYVQEQDAKHWAQQRMINEYESIRELHESTLVLIGVGNIGSILLRMAKGMNMKVIVVRLHPEKGGIVADEVVPPDQLSRVLRLADFVIIAAPLTDKTKKMMGRDNLACLRPSAFLINISRGPLIDEAALIEVLQQNSIAGVALDVFEREPLAIDNPLWTLPNVFITPHCSGSSMNRWKRTYQLWKENFELFLQGQPLKCLVDKNLGF